MKKSRPLFFLCALLVLLAAFDLDGAAAARKQEFTLSTKNVTVLQNVPDREIAPLTEPVRHWAVPGESPTTGLPWEGEYLPMLVQIDNAVTITKVKGRDVQSAGIGKRAPWGIQYADVIYEEVIVGGDITRFSVLFSDSLASGQPEKGAGPVRSARSNQRLLQGEWQSGLVYSGGRLRLPGESGVDYIRQPEPRDQSMFFDLLSGKYAGLGYRVQGVKAPGNYNADIVGLQRQILSQYVPAPRPFLFADESPYGSQYEAASTIHLDWGYKYGISHFQYDADQNAYLRYCGAGINPAKWAPFASYAAVDDRSEENQQQPAFANVIIQRVDYQYVNNSKLAPIIESIGQGNAEIFIGGRYIPGYWVRTSETEPTVFYDDQGKEIELSRGKTFIAHFPPDNLCTFSQE